MQRVSRASITVDGEVVGSIGAGLCVLVGVTHTDTTAEAAKLAEKIWHLRVFEGDAPVGDAGGEVLVVSQFTLYADTSRGRRPSWAAAAPGEVAEPLVDALVERLQALGASIATGRFGASMLVELVNDGPVTLVLDA